MAAPRSNPWILVDADLRDACEHFKQAAAFFESRRFERPDAHGLEAQLAILHAMQCGHTSFETGFLRILRVIGEPFVREDRWHQELITQASENVEGRGVILPERLADHAQKTRGFRNFAMRGYRKRFDPELAETAIQSGIGRCQSKPA